MGALGNTTTRRVVRRRDPSFHTAALSLLLLSAACTRMRSAGGAVVASSPAGARANAANWLAYNGGLANDRFSPLAEVTPANVDRLRRLCTFSTNDTVSFQASPVVVDGVMYVSTYNTIYAVDGTTCAERWHAMRPVAKPYLPVNRGVAYANGRVFRGTSDAHLVALNAADGHSLWDVSLGDPTHGESIPMAPIVWNNMLFVGTAGGDNFDVRARVYAIDPATGRQLWRFDVVPDTGAPAATWTKRSTQNPPTGGGMWTSFSVDSARGVLYIPTGNAAPDFAEELHPGDNLYTTGILALDARSGRMLGFIQPIKHDFHDWDIAAAPAIITTRGGKSLLAVPGKDGFLYGIDRAGIDRIAGSNMPSGNVGLYGAAGPEGMTVRYRTPTTTRENATTPLSTEKDTRFCPGTQGGTEWGGPAWDPSLNLVFVNAVDWCTSIRLARLDTLKGKAGAPWTGDYQGGFGRMDPKDRWQGWLTAADADDGSVKWKYRASAPLLAPVTATAGEVLFTGEVTGDVVALDARTGKVLWRDNVGQAIGAGITAYQVGGHERLAVPAGLNSPIWPVNGGPARVYVYGMQ